MIDIQPNPEHVASKGYACIKGLKMGDFVHHKDRLTQPLKKTNGQFEPISWPQAIEEIAARLGAIHKEHGGEAIAAYMGNPIGFSFWPTTAMTFFLDAFDAHKLFTPGTQDCANRFAGGDLMFGSPNDQVFPDIDHTQMLIAIGSNPTISKMTFISMPNPMERIKGIEERGGKVVWVNPRRTESAKRCGEHIAIRPDTDVFMLLGFLNEVIKRDAVDHQRVAKNMDGFEALKTIAAPWPLERAALATQIPEEQLRSLVDDYLAADGAAIYSATGVNQGRFGLMVYWLQEAINAITGNLDRRGGVLAGKRVFQAPPPPKEKRVSRIGDVPYVNSTIPGGILADEILTPGEGQVRAMFNMSGNPLLTCSGSERLASAFESLELFVCMDIVRNETAQYADYVLPGLHSLERADVPFYFFTMMGVMPTRSFSYTDAVLAPAGQAKDEGLILRQICRAAGKNFAGSAALQLASNMAEALAKLPIIGKRTGIDRLFLSMMMRSGKLGGINKMRKHPDGLLLEANQPGDYLGQRVATANGKINLAPDALIERCTELDALFDDEIAQADTLKLIQKRERFTHNSWAHNVEAFIKGERHRNYLYIHPVDAERRSLNDGDMADVSANGQTISLPVKLDSDMLCGSVAVPHGWGHRHADGLSVASTTKGVNVNIITPDGPGSLEPISGMSHMNGVKVEIRATGAQELHTA